MARQFSLAYLTVLGCAPPEMIHMAARSGYDYVSLRPIFMGLPGEPNFSLSDNKDLMRQTKTALAETGLKLLDIELARIIDGVSPKQYLPAMEAAAELGGKHVLSSIWTNDRNYNIENFAELCELAKQFGLTVDLEFVPIAGVYNLAGALDVLRAVDKENKGLMIDTHHFYRSGDKVENLLQVPREWFRFVHLCDAPGKTPDTRDELIYIMREARSYCGEGGIDIASIMNNIPEVPCSIELPNLARVKELGFEGHAKRCLETAKEYFAVHEKSEKAS